VVRLLAESYNPHVRYASAMAVGIACAGMGSRIPEAAALVEPLLTDVVDFVRQGALMAKGMLQMLQSSERSLKSIGDKHEATPCRFGAIVALGLMDIGGRNSSVRFFSKAGTLRTGAAVGLVLFSQMWYWYPLSLALSLAVTPTALVGLNQHLKMPTHFYAKSKAPPATFAYPPAMKKPEENAKPSMTSTVQLSTAAKAGVVSAVGKAKEGEEPRDGKQLEVVRAERFRDNASVAATIGSDFEGGPVIRPDEDMKGEPVAPIKEEPAVEPSFCVLANPARVVPEQQSLIEYYTSKDMVPAGEGRPEAVKVRYVPLLKGRTCGYVMLTDLSPDEPEEVLTFEDSSSAAKPAEVTEPAQTAPVVASTEQQVAPPPAPEAFEWEE
jgi:26S proteasome regulatory subunit N2